MKKRKIMLSILIVILSGFVLYGVYCLFFKRTPEKILKQQFNVSLKDFDFEVETFEEQWSLNGDGYVLIVFKLNKLTKNNIDYLTSIYNVKSLPISEMEYHQMGANRISQQVLKADIGYYIYQVNKVSNWEEIKGVKMALDFRILIVDIKNREMVLYYEIM